MKKRRVQADELIKLGCVAIVWYQPRGSMWYVAMLSVIKRADRTSYFKFPFPEDCICEGKSLEEVLLKVQIAQPQLKLFAVTFRGKEFSPPCDYDISDKNYVVDEVIA